MAKLLCQKLRFFHVFCKNMRCVFAQFVFFYYFCILIGQITWDRAPIALLGQQWTLLHTLKIVRR